MKHRRWQPCKDKTLLLKFQGSYSNCGYLYLYSAPKLLHFTHNPAAPFSSGLCIATYLNCKALSLHGEWLFLEKGSEVSPI